MSLRLKRWKSFTSVGWMWAKIPFSVKLASLFTILVTENLLNPSVPRDLGTLYTLVVLLVSVGNDLYKRLDLIPEDWERSRWLLQTLYSSSKSTED